MKEDGPPLKREMHWPTVLWYIHLHILGIYGLWLVLFEAKWLTIIFALLITSVAGLGITAGAHRLWAHRSYTASWSLRLFLMLAHTLAGVGSIHDWVLAHRIHHKFYGTSRDPYNHKNGFIYSHIFSNLMTPHPDHEKIAKEIDMCDIESDGFVLIQKRLYWVLMPIVGLLLPMNAPVEYWGESILNSMIILGVLRFAITVNISWLVNSANVIWGLKPGEKLISFIFTIYDSVGLIYKLFFKMPKSHGTVVIDDRGIHATYPAEDNSVFIITKSYWPHYHYILSWDYKSGEFGTYDRGCTTTFIKMWEILGLASEMKTASSEDIREALGKAATTGSELNDCFREVRKSTEEKTLQGKLAFKH